MNVIVIVRHRAGRFEVVGMRLGVESQCYSAPDSQPPCDLVVIHSACRPKALRHQPPWRAEKELMGGMSAPSGAKEIRCHHSVRGSSPCMWRGLSQAMSTSKSWSTVIFYIII